MIVISSQILVIVITSQIFPLLYDSIDPSSHEASFYCWFLDMDDTTVAYIGVFPTLSYIKLRLLHSASHSNYIIVWMPSKQCSTTYSFISF